MARSKKIDFTAWFQSSLSSLNLSAGSVGQVAITPGGSAATILRTRGNLAVSISGTQAPTVSARIGVGLIVMPEGQGSTVVSSPLSDGNAPWYWYESFVLAYEEMVTDVIDIPGMTSFRVPIDSKAMRILRPDREVQLVVENATVGGALSVDVFVDIRTLLGN